MNSLVILLLCFSAGNLPRANALGERVKMVRGLAAEECKVWKNDEVFDEGVKVEHKGKYYQARWWSTGNEPGTIENWAEWKLLGFECSSTGDFVEEEVEEWEEEWGNEEEEHKHEYIPPVEEEAEDEKEEELIRVVGECKKWNNDEVFEEGVKVEHNGKYYQARWWTTGNEPGTIGDWADWKILGTSCSSDGEHAEEEVEVLEEELEKEEEKELKEKGIPTKKEAEAMEADLTSSDLFIMVKNSVATLATATVEMIKEGKKDNPSNVKRVEKILTSEDWDYLFAERNADYTYRRFLQAMGKFPAICGDYSDRDADSICRRTLATMFAHFTQETGGHNPHSEIEEWRQGLFYLREAGCSETGPGCEYTSSCNAETWQGKTWPCGTGGDGKWNKYYGRGAKQLSYNYNYGPFSDAMFGEVTKLLEKPDLVASTWLNLASAIWFYVYPQPPKPSMLHVIDGTWQPNKKDNKNKLEPGFGATIMIINGGIECGHGYEKPQATNRQEYYKKFAEYFKIDIKGEELSCAHMKAFSKNGAGALLIYWDQHWTSPYECQLVKYQTPYNALKPGDYTRCVQGHFKVKLE